MISSLTIKMNSKSAANTKASIEIANAHSLGWQVMTRQEYYQNGQFVIVVWITPRNEE